MQVNKAEFKVLFESDSSVTTRDLADRHYFVQITALKYFKIKMSLYNNICI